ncbi:cytochrome P450 [Coprinopsis cinerea okayama7|uniref:Cytochrome P450 n=1 Tax=Coprinopsis cinerea (strain Okayama-7 / 130 / ATCC MYA-4618 / FGSC 9003) TaxID=240176 RepID=A8PBW0_COPC7|nr:cytochrome P450 [Coprinopsis cinerea okayama7\|eukprot:XP_001840279.2 cytochrome P450 [Coprinopsis cinerea okayama7\
MPNHLSGLRSLLEAKKFYIAAMSQNDKQMAKRRRTIRKVMRLREGCAKNKDETIMEQESVRMSQEAGLYRLFTTRRELEEEYGKDWEGKPKQLGPYHAYHQSQHGCYSYHISYVEPLSCLTWLRAKSIWSLFGWKSKKLLGRMDGRRSPWPGCTSLIAFIKESSRTSGLTTCFRVAVASAPLHNDPEIYPEPTTFKGFRFVEGSERDQLKGEGAVEDGLSRQTMVALSPSFLHFGAGRHACPGRFFAVNEVKAILAYILMTYDMKLPGKSTTPPAARWIADAQSGSRCISFGRRAIRCIRHGKVR